MIRKAASFKHVIEPRLQYDYIPDLDRNDRAKIRLVTLTWLLMRLKT